MARPFPGGQGSGAVAALLILASFIQPVSLPAGPAEDLTVGEAYYMMGNLAEASRNLSMVTGKGEPAQAARALYILGRISLLTGDFRQAKEYFERASESAGGRGAGWMALSGIGDALYAGGNYEEALRRYRIAQGRTEGTVERAIVGLKVALCENALGRGKEAGTHLRDSLRQIPVLSGWVGREEEFYHSMNMMGIQVREEAAERIYVLAGPIRGDFKADGVIGPEVPVREVRKGGRSFLEYGPLTDPVEAMILSESLKNQAEIPVEVITR